MSIWFPQYKIARLATLLGATSATLSAQTAQPTTAPPETDDTPIRLSEFDVKTSSDKGYVASESVTGSRVATKIIDLPFSVNVITSEFLNDFDAFDIASDMAYTSSLTGMDTQGNYNLRGYGATFQLRNGFYRLGLVDRVNIDRIEIIKGPNAAIYGQTSPAGLVNIITKRPKSTPSQHVTITGGSDNLYRGEANVTGLVGTVGGIEITQSFSGSAMDRDYDSPYAHLKQRLLSEAIQAKFKDGSTLLAEVEWSKRKSVTDSSTVPFEYNTAAKTYSNVLRRDLGHFSQDGPNTEQNRELTSLNLTYERRINNVWSTRLAVYGYARHAFNFNTAVGDKFDPSTNKFASRGNVLTDTLNEDGGAFQGDVLAHYRTNKGALEHKTLLTFDLSQNWRYRVQKQPNGSQYTINDVSLSNPDYSLPPTSAFAIVTRRDKTRWDTQGIFLRQQTAALDGRLIGFLGIRYDRVAYNFNFGDQFNASGKSVGTVKTPARVDHYSDAAWSPNIGVNYKLTSAIALYASRSRSFYPNAQVAKITDPRLPNETSDGWDYGVKVSLLNDKLIFTTGGYNIDRKGVKTKVTNTAGIDETVAGGNQNAKGFEFDGSYRLTDNLTILAAYGWVNARIVYDGNTFTSVGRHPQSVPVDNGSIAWKYNFPRGALQGFAWHTGIKYIGVSYPNSTATDARRNVTAPAYTLVDTGLSYTWNQGSSGRLRLRHTVRVSCKNLFDREYITLPGGLGDNRAFFFAYSLDH